MIRGVDGGEGISSIKVVALGAMSRFEEDGAIDEYLFGAFRDGDAGDASLRSVSKFINLSTELFLA